MATEIVAGPLGELRSASTADGGTALTTTAGYIQLPLKTHHIQVIPRNFATAVVAKIALNPWLVVLKTIDAMVTEPTDYSNAAQDADAATDIDVSALSTLANGDFLLVGSHLPFRGVYIDVDSTNSLGTAALDVFYWGPGGWTDYSDTDGTFSTMVFAQDGLVSWTVAAAWRPEQLATIYPEMPVTRYYSKIPLYWTRWSVDAAITDTSVTFNSMVAANRSTAYAEYPPNYFLEERIKHGEIGGIGCIEALVNAGTANLIVNVATLREGSYQ